MPRSLPGPPAIFLKAPFRAATGSARPARAYIVSSETKSDNINLSHNQTGSVAACNGGTLSLRGGSLAALSSGGAFGLPIAKCRDRQAPPYASLAPSPVFLIRLKVMSQDECVERTCLHKRTIMGRGSQRLPSVSEGRV